MVDENHHGSLEYPNFCTQSQIVMAEEAIARFGGDESIRIRIIEFIRSVV